MNQVRDDTLFTHMMRSAFLSCVDFFFVQGRNVVLYALAQKRFGDFGTGGGADSITGTAAVNEAVLKLITTGSGYLPNGKRIEAEDAREKIVMLMTIPLLLGMHTNSRFQISSSEDNREREDVPDRLW